MSLSDHERQQLDDLERSFYHSEADEKRPAHTLPTRSAVLAGILLILVAIGLLVLSVIVKLLLIGVLALLVMIGGALLLSTPRPNSSAESQRPTGTSRTAKTANGSNAHSRFADVMRERWRRRQG